ncbi:MAG: pyruvate kinase [Pirellulales bacterium]|nr:pyruvate kinase [Pirellulales bacterium]
MDVASSGSAAWLARTKIVATIGPACGNVEQLVALATAGVSVFRLNMAHASIEEHAAHRDAIRAASERVDRPLGMLVDLAGPKIRLGELLGDVLELALDQEVALVRGDRSDGANQLTTTYPTLVDELSVGDRVMLADGTVGLKVVAKQPSGVRCRVVQAGTIRSRQGVNLPGVKLSTPAMTPADLEHAAWAADVEADFLGLSFVRSAADVRQLKEFLARRESSLKVIAKIEKPEALDELESIVEAADGVMIARGDLGVEIDVAEVPVVQKRITALCRQLQKPVITATQMLDSMQNSPRPTRAEASDVANAILDGSDACMLSGETAIGRYPRAAVETMSRIARATEELYAHLPPAPPNLSRRVDGVLPVTQAVVVGASAMARELKARLLVVASHSGATALALSKQRNFVPTIGTSDREQTLRQMCLYWGVRPLAAPIDAIGALVRHIETWGKTSSTLATGDRIVLVSGTRLAGAGHNLVLVHEVQ